MPADAANGRPRLLAEFARMEAARMALLSRTREVGDEVLAREPRPGAWSVAQVVTHLALAEEAALAYLRKKLHHGGHAPLGVAGALRGWALRTALALPVRWKAPRIIAQVPATDWPTATARWQAVRQAWRSELEGIAPQLASHALFKHPVAGKLTLLQGLRFMRHHVQHHAAQVARTLQLLGTGRPA